MQYSFTTLLVIVPLVFIGSFVDAIAGGGGLITLPAYLIAGFSPRNAIATNKLSSTIGTSASTGRLIKNGCIDWPSAIPSAVLAILGSMLGAQLMLLVDENIIRYVLLVVLPIVAFVILRDGNNLDVPEEETVDRKRQMTVILLFSLVVGIYEGFYGPGTGTFLLLAFTRLAKMPLRTASGNVKVANLASNLGSLIVYLINGQTVVPIGLIAGAFSIAGHYIGAGMLLKSGTKIVRPIIFSVLGLLFVRVVYDLIVQ